MTLIIFILVSALGLFPFYPAGTVYSYGKPVSIYPEGFVRTRGQNLLADGNKEAVLHPVSGVVPISLSDADGNSFCDSIRVVCTEPESVADKFKALVLCFGESTTGTVNPDPRTGSYDCGWNWATMMQNTARTHGTDVTCLGTEKCYTAHGGWSSYTYLNWPCAAKMDPGAPPHFFNSETMWYALGLKSVTGKDFSKEAWQYDLIAKTPFGRYPVDEHSCLVEFAKKVSGLYGYPVFSGSLQDWADELAENPVNEFYSLEEAKKGRHAFSLEKYIERYRTMDDQGNRLESDMADPSGRKVRGKDGKRYRIGSRIVSQALLNKVSVCSPTHVVINVGINDGDSFSSIGATADVLKSLLECFPGIPAAHFVMRWPGACYPELWAPGYIPRKYSVNGNNDRVMAIMSEVTEWSADRKDIHILDVWHCQSPVSQHKEKYSDGVLDCSLDDVHTGYHGQMDAADQVLGWLYHCLQVH